MWATLGADAVLNSIKGLPIENRAQVFGEIVRFMETVAEFVESGTPCGLTSLPRVSIHKLGGDLMDSYNYLLPSDCAMRFGFRPNCNAVEGEIVYVMIYLITPPGLAV